MEDLEVLEPSEEEVTNFINTLSLEIRHHSGVCPSILDLAALYSVHNNIDDAVNEFMIALHEQSRRQHFNWNW